MNKSFPLIISLLLLCISIHAQVKTSTGNGLWNDPNIWNPASSPTVSDSVVISVGDSIAIFSSNAEAKFILLDTNSRLFIGKIPMFPTAGHLDIENQDGNGMLNLGEINIAGTIEIHDSENAAINNRGTIFVSNTGHLAIDNISGAGVENFGSVINYGSMIINDVVGHGIKNYYGGTGKYVLSNHGEITISEAAIVGLENIGICQNYGSIYIDSSGFNGIINQNVLENMEDASIHIHNIDISNGTGVGIFNEFTIINDGIITIKDTEGCGLHTTGKIENNNSIFISETHGNAIHNEDSIINLGVIDARDLLDTAKGIFNAASSVLINEGGLSFDTIPANSIHNFGIIQNLGSLHIMGSEDWAIYNAFGQFINMENALVSIQDIKSGIQNISGCFENFGMVLMTDVFEKAIYNSGLFINHDSISVIDCGLIGLENNDSLINLDGGAIKLYDMLKPGLGFLTSEHSYTLNDGLINIVNFENGLDVGGYFENQSGGFIEILDILETPLNIRIPETFISHGELTAELLPN